MYSQTMKKRGGNRPSTRSRTQKHPNSKMSLSKTLRSLRRYRRSGLSYRTARNEERARRADENAIIRRNAAIRKAAQEVINRARAKAEENARAAWAAAQREAAEREAAEMEEAEREAAEREEATRRAHVAEQERIQHWVITTYPQFAGVPVYSTNTRDFYVPSALGGRRKIVVRANQNLFQEVWKQLTRS
jgi:hypothetical protein